MNPPNPFPRNQFLSPICMVYKNLGLIPSEPSELKFTHGQPMLYVENIRFSKLPVCQKEHQAVKLRQEQRQQICKFQCHQEILSNHTLNLQGHTFLNNDFYFIHNPLLLVVSLSNFFHARLYRVRTLTVEQPEQTLKKLLDKFVRFVIDIFQK